jgi:riboflavin synthase
MADDREAGVFAGLVEEVGRVLAVHARPPGIRLVVSASVTRADVQIGDSICVSGCCLTVVAINAGSLEFDLGPETLARTTHGQLSDEAVAFDAPVNLERSLQVGQRLGGHFVTGHVDAVGQVLERIDENDWATFRFSVPRGLAKQLASKGSIAVDGVSLTLVDVDDEAFSVALIPHTLAATTLGGKQCGDRVNLETDLLAKYVQRQLIGDAPVLPD